MPYPDSFLMDLPEDLLDSDDAACAVAELLPWPEPDANKYTRGRLVVVGGSADYPGAAALAARAAQRTGAGYTQVVCAPEAVLPVRLAAPSLVVGAWDAWEPASLPAFAPQKPVAVCLGPGFASGDPAQADLALAVLEAAQCPVVVDGGALAALAQPRALRYLERRAEAGHPTVVTPHGGEAARLAAAWGVEAYAGEPAEEDGCGWDDYACALSGASGCTVVLKGPATAVARGEDAVTMDFGGPELAKAGTGDVLAGMLGALLAQGLNDYDAAILATSLHAIAGALAAEGFTSISVVPEDVVERIPDAIRAFASTAAE